MRFIHDEYQNLAEGYLFARGLDNSLERHPAIVLYEKHKAARHRKKLEYAALAVAAGWELVPGLFVAGLLGSSHQAGQMLPAICCVTTFMMLATGALVLAWQRKPPKEEMPVYRCWIDMVSSAHLPSEAELCARFLGNSDKDGDEDLDEATEYGALGVLRTLSALSGRLGDGWFALTNVMISKIEDADIIIVGPSGIWILESKYWGGYINIEQGKWSRVRVYHESGGRRQSEYTPISKQWDTQWLRQRDAVIGILKQARFSPDGLAPSDLVAGGIVLSHDKARLNADGSQKAPIADINQWCYQMYSSEINKHFSLDERLRAIDALLSVSQQNQKISKVLQPARAVAENIGRDILAKAREATSNSRGKSKQSGGQT